MVTISLKPETLKSYGDVIIDKAWLFFAAIGVALLVFGAAGSFPVVGPIKSEYTQYAVIVAAFFFIAVAIHAFYRPEIGARRAANPPVDTKSLELTIDPPNKSATNPVVLKGAIKGPLPPGYKLWLINRGALNDEPMLWPVMEIQPESKSWSAEYLARNLGDAEERRNLEVHLVGPAGQALIDYQRRVNRHFKDPNWIGIHKSIADSMQDLSLIAAVTVLVGNNVKARRR